MRTRTEVLGSVGLRGPAGRATKSAQIRKRVVAFSVLGLLVFIVGLGIMKPQGLATDAADAARPQATATSLSGSEITWRHVPVLLVTGAIAGLLSGLLGMGGGIFKMSCMLLLLKLDIFFARAISLVTMFVSSASALSGYLRTKQVVWPFALRMLALAAPTAVVAAVLGSRLDETTLILIFAIFVVFLGFNTIAFIIGDPDEREMIERDSDSIPQGNEGYYCGTIGALHGMTCGVLGISGGVVATPTQQLMVHMPLRRAIANTLFVSTVVTFIAGAVVLWNGVQGGRFNLSDVLFVDVFMGGAAAVGAPLGAYLSERCNVTVLRLCFVVLTFAAGFSILV